MSSNATVRKNLINGLKSLPLSSSSSRLISGNHHAHESAEIFLTDFFLNTSGLLFNSGYCAGRGLISTLCRDSIIFSDQSNHASLIDGIRQSGSKYFVFKHNNMNHLEQLLQNEKSGHPKFIITESVFSMDGDLSPSDDLLALAKAHSAHLIIDEAHASGIYGHQGRGRYSQYKNKYSLTTLHTFGKAYGAFGAFASCSHLVRELLVNKCREFIFTTALPPWLVRQITDSVNIVAQNNQWRKELFDKTNFFLNQLGGISHSSGKSPIVPILIPQGVSVTEVSKKIFSQGYEVAAIRYPTVAQGQERLRVCVHKDHKIDELKTLAQFIRRQL